MLGKVRFSFPFLLIDLNEEHNNQCIQIEFILLKINKNIISFKNITNMFCLSRLITNSF
jgi:hypothetical protein